MSQKGIIKNTITRGDIDSRDFARIFFAFFNVNCILENEDNLVVTKRNDNTLRVGSGLVMTQRTIISVDDYIDLPVESGTLGLNRKGYIYSNFIEDGVESGVDLAEIGVIYGDAVVGTAEYPELINTATTNQVALYEFEITDTTLTVNPTPLIDILSLKIILQSVLFYMSQSTSLFDVGSYQEWTAANRPSM